ncbi:MAG: hypothetical protein H6621_07735 [Halobacteriovoraceae bacterium]|nr:hypothetical protein [Halobacteriovoraceae bacterium]
MRIVLLIFFCILASCTFQKNDKFSPEYNIWYHYLTEPYTVKTDVLVIYKFTLRFSSPPQKNVFFLEVDSYDENRKHSDGNYELDQTQIFGEFEFENGELILKYTDSVTGHKYCDWTLSNIGFTEKIPFFYNSEKDTFTSKIKNVERVFYNKNKIDLPLKYIQSYGKYDEHDCEFFKRYIGPQKGFF